MQASATNADLREVNVQLGQGSDNATDDASSALETSSNAIRSSETSSIAKSENDHIDVEEAEPARPEAMLSSEDMSELTTFARKKQDVEQQIATVRAWPHLDPFKDICTYAADAGVLDQNRAKLDKLAIDLQHDRQERDRLDSQVQQFNIHDMNRLRSVAKETSKRHLSGSDTDLIELALETVYALDKLVRLLRARKVELDLAELRLKWESLLCSSWRDLVLIQRDLSAFERRCEVSSYEDAKQDGTLPASRPGLEGVGQTPQNDLDPLMQTEKPQRRRPFSSRRVTSEVIKLESSRLTLRIKSLNSDKVLPAGRILDALIDQRQVPVKLIDEQEKLEEAIPQACKIEERAATLTLSALNRKGSMHAQRKATTKAATSPSELSMESNASDALSCSLEPSRSSLSSCTTSSETTESPPEPSFAGPSRSQSSEVAESVSHLKHLKLTKSPRILTPTRVVGKRPNRYRPDPRSELDLAVGHIVNKMPISVKILPARLDDVPLDVRKDSTDLSGRYWVGDPDPRLCFCRILRSNLVMVRVGGGWQELSQFIFQHYAHLSTTEPGSPRNLSQPTQYHATTPIKSHWMRSASGPADPTVLRHHRSKAGSRDEKGNGATSGTPRGRVVTMPTPSRHGESSMNSCRRKASSGNVNGGGLLPQGRLGMPNFEPDGTREARHDELPRSDSSSSVIIRTDSPF